ncbi:MAG: hypothetical protein FH751_03935 [Firmicutes bacterium]|nr:hypothetical protein [Bacillota bacterium]
MKIIKKFLLIGIIIVLSFINYTFAEDISTNKPLIDTFNSTDAEFVEINLNSNSKIKDKFLSMEELNKLGVNLIDMLNIKGELTNKNNLNESDLKNYYSYELIRGKEQNHIIIYGRDDYNNYITAILLTYKDDYNTLEETDLVIDVINNDKNEVEKTKKRIKEIYSKLDSNPQFTTCIVGSFEGKLSSVDKYQVVSKALNATEGKKVEGVVDSSLVSISAYTPNIDKYIYTGKRKMNLNLALRYNDYEKKTYIWIGSPIITTGY